MLDVIEVEGDVAVLLLQAAVLGQHVDQPLLLPGHVVEQLAQPGHAGLDLQPLVPVLALYGLGHLVVFDVNGARPDQGHVALEHVEQLAELVKVNVPQGAANPGGDAALLGALLDLFPGAQHHGPELVNLERFAIPAHPRVGVKDRAGRIKLDEHGHQ